MVPISRYSILKIVFKYNIHNMIPRKRAYAMVNTGSQQYEKAPWEKIRPPYEWCSFLLIISKGGYFGW